MDYRGNTDAGEKRKISWPCRITKRIPRSYSLNPSHYTDWAIPYI
jgi:hypothetical protein